MPGTPDPNRIMTMSEADGLVRRLIGNWIEAHS
jgi:hypothetical protein